MPSLISYAFSLLPLGAHALFAGPGSIPLWNMGLPGIESSFDYIIVGGGTSGLAVASRIAQDRSVSVAIVEAGGLYEIESGLYSIAPGFAAAANTGTDPDDDSLLVDWNFDTVPQTSTTGRAMRYARGKALGGTSGRNFLVYHRCVYEITLPDYKLIHIDLPKDHSINGPVSQATKLGVGIQSTLSTRSPPLSHHPTCLYVKPTHQ